MAFDHQRINQSTTWKLAGQLAPELRPWLLMLWYESWQQIPVASLPNDDDEICAIVGIPVGLFAAHRHILLRGWDLHSDGRLYHRIVTAIALQMLSTRAAWRERQKGHRAAQPHDSTTVTLESRADVNLTLNQHRTSPSAAVDNSGASGPIEHWTKIGKALDIEPKPGESGKNYAKRIQDLHRNGNRK